VNLGCRTTAQGPSVTDAKALAPLGPVAVIVCAPASTLQGTVNDWLNVPVVLVVTVPSVWGVEAMLRVSVADGVNEEPVMVRVRPSGWTAAFS
jgi:hypothetical protein